MQRRQRKHSAVVFALHTRSHRLTQNDYQELSKAWRRGEGVVGRTCSVCIHVSPAYSGFSSVALRCR